MLTKPETTGYNPKGKSILYYQWCGCYDFFINIKSQWYLEGCSKLYLSFQTYTKQRYPGTNSKIPSAPSLFFQVTTQPLLN